MDRGGVMSLSQDQQRAESGVVERPLKPSVGVVMRGSGDRSVIGEQLAYVAVLRYLDSIDGLGEAMAGRADRCRGDGCRYPAHGHESVACWRALPIAGGGL